MSYYNRFLQSKLYEFVAFLFMSCKLNYIETSRVAKIIKLTNKGFDVICDEVLHRKWKEGVITNWNKKWINPIKKLYGVPGLSTFLGQNNS